MGGNKEEKIVNIISANYVCVYKFVCLKFSEFSLTSFKITLYIPYKFLNFYLSYCGLHPKFLEASEIFLNIHLIYFEIVTNF